MLRDEMPPKGHFRGAVLQNWPFFQKLSCFTKCPPQMGQYIYPKKKIIIAIVYQYVGYSEWIRGWKSINFITLRTLAK